jgi:hypothetical protein
MKFSKIIGAAVWMTMSTAAVAQTGGYPASPSHGVVGAPRPDGTLRYGNEPGNNTNSRADSSSSSPERPKAEETTGSGSNGTGGGPSTGAPAAQEAIKKF